MPGGSKKKTTVRRRAVDEGEEKTIGKKTVGVVSGDGQLAKKGRISVKEENVDLRALVDENKVSIRKTDNDGSMVQLHTLTVAELKGHGQTMGVPLEVEHEKGRNCQKDHRAHSLCLISRRTVMNGDQSRIDNILGYIRG